MVPQHGPDNMEGCQPPKAHFVDKGTLFTTGREETNAPPALPRSAF
eukprot:CAMPEP_0195107004 /NCGR_PEP_ID=MMETSP0448-20130528/81823_1 /TAXON_ID=66468 /ORGANISM="Heterocapsa triquestra, Strain CCMP 448" /LENGTH=45 /DNA_ID= /DNA_START= /DNA_END= /DNA_ORIENTATION=